MQRYKGGNQQRHAEPPTKFNPSTGQFHPWNEERQYLSRFPLSFRGCFICGGTDHRGAKDCPVAQFGNYDKKQFLMNYGRINHILSALIERRHRVRYRVLYISHEQVMIRI